MIAWLFLLYFACSPVEETCNKVDFLFVIDNSGSMSRHQENLRNNISSLIQELKTLSEVTDYQIGVITTDDYQSNPEQCRELGSLVTHSAFDTEGKAIATEDGTPSTRACLSSDKPYITNTTNLDEEFSCLASVGAQGSANEKQLSALVSALKDKNGCNQGFIRDDSLLVTMLITDEDASFDTGFLKLLLSMGSNETSYTTGSEWADAVLSIKNSYPNQVVVLSMINQSSSPELTEFTQSFPNGFIGDISATDYAAEFKKAAANIATACKNYGQTCATNECCYPTDLQRLLTIILLPLSVLGITGYLFPVAMGKTAAREGKPSSYAQKKGASISLFITALTLIGALLGLCLNCIPMSGSVVSGLLLFSSAALYLSSKGK